jgi:hypothetical protein
MTLQIRCARNRHFGGSKQYVNNHYYCCDSCIVRCTPLRQNRYTRLEQFVTKSFQRHYPPTLLICALLGLMSASTISVCDTKITTLTVAAFVVFRGEAKGHSYRHVKRAKKHCLPNNFQPMSFTCCRISHSLYPCYPTLASFCDLPLFNLFKFINWIKLEEFFFYIFGNKNMFK